MQSTFFQPDVSFAIPAYNCQDYIEACINSCLSQQTTYTYEIVVCDDASTDNTLSVIKNHYSDAEFVKILENETNVGVGMTRNQCIINSKGRYLYLLDGDDYIHPKTLELLVTSIELAPATQAVYSDYIYVDDTDQRSHQISADHKPIACGHLFKKSIFFRLGLYSDLRIGEEREFMDRFNKSLFTRMRIPLPLYRYRQHSLSITKTFIAGRSYDDM